MKIAKDYVKEYKESYPKKLQLLPDYVIETIYDTIDNVYSSINDEDDSIRSETIKNNYKQSFIKLIFKNICNYDPKPFENFLNNAPLRDDLKIQLDSIYKMASDTDFANNNFKASIGKGVSEEDFVGHIIVLSLSIIVDIEDSIKVSEEDMSNITALIQRAPEDLTWIYKRKFAEKQSEYDELKENLEVIIADATEEEKKVLLRDYNENPVVKLFNTKYPKISNEDLEKSIVGICKNLNLAGKKETNLNPVKEGKEEVKSGKEEVKPGKQEIKLGKEENSIEGPSEEDLIKLAIELSLKETKNSSKTEEKSSVLVSMEEAWGGFEKLFSQAMAPKQEFKTEGIESLNEQLEICKAIAEVHPDDKFNNEKLALLKSKLNLNESSKLVKKPETEEKVSAEKYQASLDDYSKAIKSSLTPEELEKRELAKTEKIKSLQKEIEEYQEQLKTKPNNEDLMIKFFTAESMLDALTGNNSDLYTGEL